VAKWAAFFQVSRSGYYAFIERRERREQEEKRAGDPQALLNAQARHKPKTGRVMAIKGFVQLWLSNPCIHFALDALSR
jgi:hypothetical protein